MRIWKFNFCDSVETQRIKKKNTITLPVPCNEYVLTAAVQIQIDHLTKSVIFKYWTFVLSNNWKFTEAYLCIPFLLQWFSLNQKNTNNHGTSAKRIFGGAQELSLKVFGLRVGSLITEALSVSSRPNTSTSVPSIDPCSRYTAGPLLCTVITPTPSLESMEMIIDLVIWQANVDLNHLCTLDFSTRGSFSLISTRNLFDSRERDRAIGQKLNPALLNSSSLCSAATLLLKFALSSWSPTHESCCLAATWSRLSWLCLKEANTPCASLCICIVLVSSVHNEITFGATSESSTPKKWIMQHAEDRFPQI